MRARTIVIARQPGARLQPNDFAIVEAALPALGPGLVQVRNLWMSVDPYMRLPLTGQPGLHEPKPVGAPMDGGAVGIVEESRADALPAGTLVLSELGWRDRFVAPASAVRRAPPLAVPPQLFLGALGLTGITAYVAIEEVLRPAAGETVLISGAAGAVGSVAAQLAKLRGARVIGVAGSAAKCRFLTETLGLDAAIDYRRDDLDARLAAAAPDGLNGFLDNVGGPVLDAALKAMAMFGRIAMCGSIALYETANYRRGPDEYYTIPERALTITGVNVFTAMPRADTIVAHLAALMADGRLVSRETVMDGLDQAPAALVSLFTGGNVGKLLVRLGDA